MAESNFGTCVICNRAITHNFNVPEPVDTAAPIYIETQHRSGVLANALQTLQTRPGNIVYDALTVEGVFAHTNEMINKIETASLINEHTIRLHLDEPPSEARQKTINTAVREVAWKTWGHYNAKNGNNSFVKATLGQLTRSHEQAPTCKYMVASLLNHGGMDAVATQLQTGGSANHPNYINPKDKNIIYEPAAFAIFPDGAVAHKTCLDNGAHHKTVKDAWLETEQQRIVTPVKHLTKATRVSAWDPSGAWSGKEAFLRVPLILGVAPVATLIGPPWMLMKWLVSCCSSSFNSSSRRGQASLEMVDSSPGRDTMRNPAYEEPGESEVDDMRVNVAYEGPQGRTPHFYESLNEHTLLTAEQRLALADEKWHPIYKTQSQSQSQSRSGVWCKWIKIHGSDNYRPVFCHSTTDPATTYNENTGASNLHIAFLMYPTIELYRVQKWWQFHPYWCIFAGDAVVALAILGPAMIMSTLTGLMGASKGSSEKSTATSTTPALTTSTALPTSTTTKITTAATASTTPSTTSTITSTATQSLTNATVFTSTTQPGTVTTTGTTVTPTPTQETTTTTVVTAVTTSFTTTTTTRQQVTVPTVGPDRRRSINQAAATTTTALCNGFNALNQHIIVQNNSWSTWFSAKVGNMVNWARGTQTPPNTPVPQAVVAAISANIASEIASLARLAPQAQLQLSAHQIDAMVEAAVAVHMPEALQQQPVRVYGYGDQANPYAATHGLQQAIEYYPFELRLGNVVYTELRHQLYDQYGMDPYKNLQQGPGAQRPRRNMTRAQINPRHPRAKR